MSDKNSKRHLPIGECDFVFRADPNTVYPIIDCKMRCDECCVTIQFPVKCRSADEDFMHWMKSVQECAGEAHRFIVPNCKSTTCCLQIPIPEGSKAVGEVVKS